MLRQAKLRPFGVSLIELLITLVLIVLLSTLAIDAYSSLVSRIRIYAATSELHAGLLYTRSEAIKHGGNVIICRSANTHTLQPSCEGENSDSAGSSGWGDGWLIFHDRNVDGRVSGTDTILRVQGRLFSTREDGAIIPSPNRKQIRFNSLGQVYGTFMQFSVGKQQNQVGADHNRYICIASGGRARVDKKNCNAK
jgi:type IV fimbrial biogenesis protein FimT